jgi:MerR HTH family regulatory protein
MRRLVNHRVCANCGRAQVYSGNRCPACYRYEADHGIHRPAALNDYLPERQPDGAMTTKNIARKAGISVRQLNTWVHKGLVTPSHAIGFGSGVRWWWSEEDLMLLQSIKERIDWGMRPAGAARTDEPPSRYVNENRSTEP